MRKVATSANFSASGVVSTIDVKTDQLFISLSRRPLELRYILSVLMAQMGHGDLVVKKVMKMLAEGDLDFVQDEETGEITVYRKIRAGQKVVSVPSNLFDNVGSSADGTKTIQVLFGQKVFDTAKPVPLAERLVELVSWQSPDNDLILDFFAGSGTTAHAVINLNRQDGGKRKYILVEMADYFDTVLLPRIKKVVFSDKWKDGKAQDGGKGISHFVKYYELEQYEDTLRRVKYDDSDLFDDPYQDPYNQYVFLRDLKMLEALEVDLAQNKVKVDLSKLYPLNPPHPPFNKGGYGGGFQELTLPKPSPT